MVDVTKDSIYPKIKKEIEEEDVGNSYTKVSVVINENYIDLFDRD